MGRAARNVEGRAILYADRETDSMKKAVGETRRRRAIQEEYNREHGITPQTIKKRIAELLETIYEKDYVTVDIDLGKVEDAFSPERAEREAAQLREKMLQAAQERRYEDAAALRDRLREIERKLLKS